MRRAGLAAALMMLVGAHRMRAAEPEIKWSDLMSARARLENGSQQVDYPSVLKLLDGKDVTIYGWITPINLGDGATVTTFLLTGTPGTCPFCLGVGPEGFVLVSAVKPVPADVTVELLLRGRFQLTPNDPVGFYYRLQNALAKQVSQ